MVAGDVARLTVLSGPSGVGKGTVVAEVRRRYPGVWVSVSATTRRPRPGEVDGELSAEIGEECSKYGEVAAVHVHEVPPTSGGAVAPEEAVRIFVKFGKQAAAMKAYIDLDGRYFGGRNVWVAFFSEAEFEQGALAPSEREPK